MKAVYRLFYMGKSCRIITPIYTKECITFSIDHVYALYIKPYGITC